jgi:hypothetical protein
MRSHGHARPHALVDLYVPARLGSPDALQALAANAGLDAIVLVAEDAFELPNPEIMAAVNGNGGPRVLVAPMVAGPGYRFELFLPSAEVNLESIEAAGDPRVVERAVAELGGLALAVSPRQGQGGEVSRLHPTFGEGSEGVVALVLPGSRLGRDLDLEDAAVAERPILGASGPFATLEQIGRYATLLPIDVQDGDLVTVSARLLGALQRGRGIAVELAQRHTQREARPDPREGRGDEAGEQKPRHRRRRRKKSKGDAA